jgi:tetrahydromethanopterin S-methyltransferase subunit D
MDSGLAVVLASGATGSALMMVLTILGGNIANAFGTGVSPASGQTASGNSIP